MPRAERPPGGGREAVGGRGGRGCGRLGRAVGAGGRRRRRCRPAVRGREAYGLCPGPGGSEVDVGAALRASPSDRPHNRGRWERVVGFTCPARAPLRPRLASGGSTRKACGRRGANRGSNRSGRLGSVSPAPPRPGSVELAGARWQSGAQAVEVLPGGDTRRQRS